MWPAQTGLLGDAQALLVGDDHFAELDEVKRRDPTIALGQRQLSNAAELAVGWIPLAAWARDAQADEARSEKPAVGVAAVGRTFRGSLHGRIPLSPGVAQCRQTSTDTCGPAPQQRAICRRL